MNINDLYNIVLLMYITLGHMTLEVYYGKMKQARQGLIAILSATAFYIISAICWIIAHM